MITKTACRSGSVLGPTFNNNNAHAYSYRLNVHSGPSYYEGIAMKVKVFFTHAYADCRMFFRAFSSLARSVTVDDIDRQMDALHEFKIIVENCCSDRQLVSDSFNQLSPSNHNLFFLVDQGYTQQFVLEKDATKIEDMKKEILRECDRIFNFQLIMLGIKSVFRRTLPPSSQPNTIPTSSATQMQSTTATAGSASRTQTGSNVNIPGTMAYVAENIPQDIKDKARAITELLDQLDDLPNTPLIIIAPFHRILCQFRYLMLPTQTS